MCGENAEDRELVERFIDASDLRFIFDVVEEDRKIVLNDGEGSFGLVEGLVEMLADSDGIAKMVVYGKLDGDDVCRIEELLRAGGHEADADAVKEELEYAEFVIESGNKFAASAS